MRWRTPLVALLVLTSFFPYAWLAATVAEALPDHWAVQLVYYFAAGIIWVFPVLRILVWAARDPEPNR